MDFKEDIINVNHQLQRTREMKYIIVSTKTTSGTRLLPMESDVKEAFLRILKNRRKPKRGPMVDGYGGFLFLDKNGRPMVALHWEKYMQHARENIIVSICCNCRQLLLMYAGILIVQIWPIQG
mgnify:CR=1 FL=1